MKKKICTYSVVYCLKRQTNYLVISLHTPKKNHTALILSFSLSPVFFLRQQLCLVTNDTGWLILDHSKLSIMVKFIWIQCVTGPTLSSFKRLVHMQSDIFRKTKKMWHSWNLGKYKKQKDKLNLNIAFTID